MYLLDPRNWRRRYQIAAIALGVIFLSFLSMNPWKTLGTFVVFILIGFGIRIIYKICKNFYLYLKEVKQLHEETKYNTYIQEIKKDSTPLTQKEEETWSQITTYLKNDDNK